MWLYQPINKRSYYFLLEAKMLWTFIFNKRTKLMTHTKEKDMYQSQKRAVRDQLLTLAKEALASSRDRANKVPIWHDAYDD